MFLKLRITESKARCGGPDLQYQHLKGNSSRSLGNKRPCLKGGGVLLHGLKMAQCPSKYHSVMTQITVKDMIRTYPSKKDSIQLSDKLGRDLQGWIILGILSMPIFLQIKYWNFSYLSSFSMPYFYTKPTNYLAIYSSN